MDLDKLFEAFSVDERRFTISSLVIIPVVYTILYLYLPSFREVSIFEKCVFSICGSTLLIYLFVLTIRLTFKIGGGIKESQSFIVSTTTFPCLEAFVVLARFPFVGEGINALMRSLAFVVLPVTFSFVLIGLLFRMLTVSEEVDQGYRERDAKGNDSKD